VPRRRSRGRELSATEAATAEMLIEAATGEIAAAADKTDAWADDLTPVPRIIKFICIEAVHRVMSNPKSLRSQSETLGAFQHSESYQADSAAGSAIHLTEREVLMVRREVYGRTSGSGRAESTASEIHDLIYGS
jgi:hypothetical protein